MSAAGRSESGFGPLETLLLWLVGALAATSVVVWSVGAIAARVFGGAWPRSGIQAMPGVLSRLRANLADPGAAWPPADRRLMPGPIAFYSTAIVMLGLAVAVMVVGYRILRSDRNGRDGARWASRRDLRSLFVRRAEAGRLTVGKVGRSLVAAEPRQSVIVFGPTQTMKTTGLAVPAILEWAGPVIATSVKTDLLRDTIEMRRSLGGDTMVYDPARATGFARANWSPVASCRTWSGAQRTASWLTGAVSRGPDGIENASFWYSAATKLLAPVLLAAAISGGTMRDVIHWIETQDKEEVLEILDDAGLDEPNYAYRASISREDRTRSNVFTTAETVLAAYSDPAVLDSSDSSDINAERFFDGGAHMLYLAAPAHEQKRLQPLFATLVQELVAAAYERASLAGKPLDPPLLLVLDECANIAPLRDLATLASTGAGQGIQLVTVFQDLAQVEAVYGRGVSSTIVSNHRAKVILSGIADPATLDYAARLLGDEEIQQTSATRGYRGDRSTTESTTFRNLAPGHALREMRPGNGLLVYGHLPPARIRLRPWFRDRHLRRLVERPEVEEA